MRFTGTLHDWNEQRGFGFIRPLEGGEDVFVHASTLPTPRPQSSEVLSFAVALDREGRKKAVDVRRQATEAAGLAADKMRSARPQARVPHWEERTTDVRGTGILGSLVGLALLCGVSWYAWRERSSAAPETASAPAITRAQGVDESSRFRCDGRTHCSQMTSCAEATYFLKNCPGVKMDGNHDGTPCEQQWCR